MKRDTIEGDEKSSGECVCVWHWSVSEQPERESRWQWWWLVVGERERGVGQWCWACWLVVDGGERVWRWAVVVGGGWGGRGGGD